MLLTSKGAATVSGGSFVVFAATGHFHRHPARRRIGDHLRCLPFHVNGDFNLQPIGNSVATVVIAKWSSTFDPKVAERHLYPERYPETAQADAALDDGNLLPEDMNEANPHPTGIHMDKASAIH